MKRIGPRMEEVRYIVEREPGLHPANVAASVGPNGSVSFGMRSVNRAVSAGLVHRRPDPQHRSRSLLYPGNKCKDCPQEETANE